MIDLATRWGAPVVLKETEARLVRVAQALYQERCRVLAEAKARAEKELNEAIMHVTLCYGIRDKQLYRFNDTGGSGPITLELEVQDVERAD